eukprot:437929_1
MSDTNKASVECTDLFTQCKQANRIKLILQRYDDLLSQKGDKTEKKLQQQSHMLIHNILLNDNYSHLQLLNDFYHIKYVHNTNNDPNQFHSFYNYLFDNDNVLQCDISSCLSAQSYYRRRQLFREKHDFDTNVSSLDLLCRIHTYFIHSYEMSQLTPNEIQFIEIQINELKLNNDDQDMLYDKRIEIISETLKNKKHYIKTDKYMLTEDQCISYTKIAGILKNFNINITKNNLTNAFDTYDYHNQQLLDDLCDVLLNENDVLLSQILTNELNFTEKHERKRICNIILQEYFDKTNLNNNNFIKVLRKTVSELCTNINCDKVAEIARDAGLTGNLFTKGPEFKNSIHFGKIFKSIDNFSKKQWQKIYIKINKWEFYSNPSHVTSNITPPQATTNIVNDSVSVMIEEKLDYSNKDNINTDTDTDIINKFCALTNATKNIAIPFLKEAQWNINAAVDIYYSNNGNVSKLLLNKVSIDEIKRSEDNSVIYSHGIEFWYWNKHKKKHIIIIKQKNHMIKNKNFHNK